jgi:hypothetical protein
VFLLAAYVGAGLAPGPVRVETAECGARRGAAALLATPLARDAERGNEGDADYWARREATRKIGGLPLGAQVTLLPTPTARDGMGGPGHAADGGLNLRTAVVTDWGKYAAAVQRWEAVTGVPAPEPTEVGPRGGRRLAPALSEWMMGLAPGYLTGHLARPDALRLAGNGVCPAQGAHALQVLLTP